MSTSNVICLLDCHAFYCSAETLFRPWLRDKPVCVASNNDGAVVARNDAAKLLGIKMGAPVFEIMPLVTSGQLYLFSSNYALYQALSDRIMAIIAELAPESAPYSIDESFADLSGVPDPYGWAVNAQKVILERTGMPVGIGIGPTKTLAKLANWAAKRWKAKTGSVVELLDIDKRRKLLQYAPVDEVWGIGSKLSKRLIEDHGIKTAWMLAQADHKQLRKHFNVNVERTARELTGVACLPFHDDDAKKQMIACTRSFGSKLSHLDQLKTAVATYAANVCEKARRQNSLVACIQVYIRTSWFISPEKRYGRSISLELPAPSADTRVITQAALSGLTTIYREGYDYAKAGVVLTHLVDATHHTQDLFTPGDTGASQRVMETLDQINRKMGRGSVCFARTKIEPGWGMRRQYLSPSYMTDWNQLLKVRC